MSDSTAPPETPADAEAEEVAAPEPDLVREPLVEQVRAALGDAVLETVIAKADVWIRVTAESWRAAAQYLKDHGFSYFTYLAGIDWQPSAELSQRYEQVFTGEEPADSATEDAEAASAIETGVAGGGTRFQVMCRLYDVDRKLGVTLKADLDESAPAIDSLVPVYRGADWHERETWEMYGFDFVGHPGLRHLYLPSEFEGFPMRKDFPLLARVVKPWPGLVDKEPIPGEDDEEEEPAS